MLPLNLVAWILCLPGQSDTAYSCWPMGRIRQCHRATTGHSYFYLAVSVPSVKFKEPVFAGSNLFTKTYRRHAKNN